MQWRVDNFVVNGVWDKWMCILTGMQCSLSTPVLQMGHVLLSFATIDYLSKCTVKVGERDSNVERKKCMGIEEVVMGKPQEDMEEVGSGRQGVGVFRAWRRVDHVGELGVAAVK
jgi:hypothetical protein